MSSPRFNYPVLEVRVVDGDTVDVTLDLGFNAHYHTAVRLEGIDAPELHIAAEAKAALVSKSAVEAWLKLVPPDQLRVSSTSREKYGRVLGDLYNDLNGNRLSQWLLLQKVVHVYDGSGPRPPWFDQELTLIEALALNFLPEKKEPQ